MFKQTTGAATQTGLKSVGDDQLEIEFAAALILAKGLIEHIDPEITGEGLDKIYKDLRDTFAAGVQKLIANKKTGKTDTETALLALNAIISGHAGDCLSFLNISMSQKIIMGSARSCASPCSSSQETLWATSLDKIKNHVEDPDFDENLKQLYTALIGQIEQLKLSGNLSDSYGALLLEHFTLDIVYEITLKQVKTLLEHPDLEQFRQTNAANISTIEQKKLLGEQSCSVSTRLLESCSRTMQMALSGRQVTNNALESLYTSCPPLRPNAAREAPIPAPVSIEASVENTPLLQQETVRTLPDAFSSLKAIIRSSQWNDKGHGFLYFFSKTPHHVEQLRRAQTFEQLQNISRAALEARPLLGRHQDVTRLYQCLSNASSADGALASFNSQSIRISL
ncbi:hypothetical protein [Legionella sp. CNM-4043-24]|uniref:hypothetical protein n=1 Tax=Legionella sp. CNM-4043-24 TaxID=3421646 RepID=UPI00403AABD1